jgi:hypothetical protein
MDEAKKTLLQKILGDFIAENHDLEKLLEIYSHELLNSEVMEGTTFHLQGGKGIFKAEGVDLRKLYTYCGGDSEDPIGGFLEELLEAATKREVNVFKVRQDEFKIVYEIEVTEDDIHTSTKGNRGAFDEDLSEAINEGMETLGPFIKNLLFIYMEKKNGYANGEAMDIKILHGGLSSVLGEGTQIVELSIARRFYAKRGIGFRRDPSWNLEDYIEEARREDDH